jgi:large subunit ribosomal protein L24
MTIKLKKNDLVQVLAGKEKDKTGKILRINKKSNRVVIEKINMIKKHIKPRSAQEPGGIIDKEGSINISNVGIYCQKCKKAVRYSIKIKDDNKKARICKKCGTEL